MMTDTDIRWQQRLANYTKGFNQLALGVGLAKI